MRLDYALYGLAVILFVLTAVNLVYITEPNDQIIYSTLTGVVGLLCLGGGYLMRPKANLALKGGMTQPAAVEQTAQTETPKIDAQTTEFPKTENTTPSVAPIDVEPSLESLKPEKPTTVETPPEMQVSTSPQVNSAFSQIRGINQKRAEQLRANGINTLEDLAGASADDLAEKLSISPRIVKMWIGSAKKRVK